MELSDDEAEAVLLSVSNYHFVDGRDEPVSFHLLPVQWIDGGERQEGKRGDMFLHGSADNGLEKIYKPVVAWRFDLSNVKPEIAVLSKEGDWILLQKPRKSYQGIIRSVLITVQCLSYSKRNAEAAGKAVWDHLSKAFSMYEDRPSRSDLVDHMALIKEALKQDAALAKSKFMVDFLKEKSRISDEDIQATTKPGFIVDDAEGYMIGVEDESDDDDDDNLFDSVCAFCDNGGDLLCCEGRCLRSFHATVEAGEDSICESLGFTPEEVNAMPSFLCKNCQYKQHQCFACGKLGSSNKSLGAEVFPCVSATCGQFYHPHCVAQLIYQDSGVSVEELKKSISLGESFTCPIHKCFVCKQGENKKDDEMQFSVCRRCPKSYHRKCLPREIRFEKAEEDAGEEEDEEKETRAWENLLPNRILIYCLEHEIDEELKTPSRDHVRFPDVDGKKTTFESKKRRMTSESLVVRDNSLLKKRKLTTEELQRGRTTSTLSKQKMISDGGNRTTGKGPSGLDVSRKVMVNKTSKKEVLTRVEKNNSLGDRLYEFYKGPGSVKSGKREEHDVELHSGKIAEFDPTTKASSAAASLDPARERRLRALMKQAASSITLEDVIKKHKVPSTCKSSNKHAVERNITQGKVEGSVEAVRTALKKLQEGCSIEDAQAVCAPEIISQIYKWKNKLTVYLAPFLHGMRYTSFGRHFTKVEKLEKIVDRLHLYAQNGDTIVDFCCGSNDFSIIMKKKLEETGKKCYFKNFDIIQPKNDFCFEKRDWMTVQKHELPHRNKLIMGLNPPFGVNAALANQFIAKALEFNPKLIILIVPPETKRLPYDLIWEDDQLLSGKSFYLPGSVDENDKQMDQWNATAPPLYLWSHPDWSETHRAIARKASHGSVSQGPVEDGHSVENKDENVDNLMVINAHLPLIGNSSDFVGGAVSGEGHKETPSKGNDDRGFHVSSGHLKNQVNLRKQRGGKRKKRRTVVRDNKHDGGFSSEIQKKRSPSNEQQRKAYQPSGPGNSGSSLRLGIAYDRTAANIPDDTCSNVKSHEEPYLSLTHGWSHGARPSSIYTDGNLGEPALGYGREMSNTLNYRPYSLGMEDTFFRRESDIHAQLHTYGQQDSNIYTAGSNYTAGHELFHGTVGSVPATYGHAHLGSSFDASYRMNMSVMQRYEARLDESNHTRPSALGTQPVFNYEHDPRRYSSNMYDPRAPVPNVQQGPLEFAHGYHQSFSNQNSAGWIE
ncbi:protein ENHANCED DOWNY MILDEW 2 [Argentina anserina]|uniref:protein ENHANCED DOWNY MILDEW 2 n=1 Tax=Argentina anserina TaxID=57926 RepID=UPI00217647C8|nr:protein ENHANCED DOWNY MILDEW 2 [Potentilla anserina]XP_050369244.1 protein ENHANCED DOWNY MILDEW 2 [Potentilla anserina]